MRFRHNDLDHFERCLNNCASEEKILVVSEGVFSMEGDLAELRGLVNLSKSNAARIYVDEAHGLGVLGRTGAGAAEHLGVLDEVDIVMGTFSKALASVGGFIAGPREVVDYLKHTARPFVFSASLPAASVAAAGAALEIIRKEPERRLRLLQMARAAARGAARARLFGAGWGDGDRAGGDPGGRGFVPAVQGASGRRHLRQPGAEAGRGAEFAPHLLHFRTHRSAHREASRDAYEGGGVPRHRALD